MNSSGLGLVVALVGAVIAVAAFFGFNNIPFTVLGVIILVIGIIALTSGGRQ